MRYTTIISVMLLALLTTTASVGTPESKPWTVRVVVFADGDICKGGAVQLDLDPWASAPLRVPIKSKEVNDAEWAVSPLDPGDYKLHAQVVSCNGVSGPLNLLDIQYDKNNRRKEIYVGIRYEKGVFNLDYLEVATAWDGSGIISIRKDGDSIVATNISNVKLERCEWEEARIYEQFLADDSWGAYNVGDSRVWPENLKQLKPGRSVVLKTSGVVTVIRKGGPPPKILVPTAKRYILVVQPRAKHFLTMTEPVWAPGGLPTCDRYYMEYPADENDPVIKVWDDE